MKSAPSTVGNYRAVVTLVEDNNYKGASAALEFVISKAANAWTEQKGMKTGDSANIFVWFTLLTISSAAAVSFVLFRRRNQR